MNCLRHKHIYPEKQGVKYTELNLRPFDLVLFEGGDGVSNFIRYLSKRELGAEADAFSHVGMIITSEVLSHKNIKPGVLYIFESSSSGKLGGNVYNINDETWVGVQVREFEAVIKSYDESPKTAIAVRRVKNNPLDVMDIHELREKMAYLFGKYNGRPYEVNMMQLFAAMFPSLRRCRPNIGRNKFIFCSELVAIIYKKVGILQKHLNASNVIPADFVVHDEDNQVDRSKFYDIEYIRA